VKITVTVSAGDGPAGYDSVIMSVPARWHALAGGEPAFLAHVAGIELRAWSEVTAAAMGEKLHHAEWTITSDPAQVTTLGMMHADCATCRGGVDQALAFLRENPGEEVAVGQLWWAD
jgi:hypothetical protein